LDSAFGDEANIAYAGFTRAIRELHLPPDFKGILTSELQQAIKRYEPVQVSRTSKSPFITRKRAPRSALPGTRFGESTTEANLPKPLRKKPFKIGDRVRTSHGTGTIAKVDGEKYLVDLDEQGAQLWEKAWGLTKM
jgi:co-chaperonin GroES (HSP10)